MGFAADRMADINGDQTMTTPLAAFESATSAQSATDPGSRWAQQNLHRYPGLTAAQQLRVVRSMAGTGSLPASERHALLSQYVQLENRRGVVIVDYSDPSVRWANQRLRRFAPLLTQQLQVNILRDMSGMEHDGEHVRWEALLQSIELETGDRFPPNTPLRVRREMLEQEADVRRRSRRRGR